MTKAELLEALAYHGVQAPAKATKAELEQLLASVQEDTASAPFSDLRQRAAAAGLVIPEGWSDTEVAGALAELDAAAPPRVESDWEPGSPRG